MREDWIGTFLGEICKFSQGIQVPKEEQFLETFDKCTRFLRIIDFTQDNEPIRYISYSEGIHNVEPEDISMVRYGTVGFVCTGKKGAIANNLFRIIPIISINNSFLILYLNSELFKSQLNSKGATMLALSFGIISPIQVPLPPLPEQRAIVKKLDSLFSSLDAGVADLKKAQQQLKIYRQAVLKKAFEGNKSWCFKSIKDVIKTIDGDRGKNYPKKSDFFREEYCLFLSTKNVRNGKFLFEDNIFITKDKDNELRSGKLERGDVVLTTRGTLGNVALFDDEIRFENIRINSGMLILRIKDNKELNQKYLMNFINSPIFFDQLKSKQSGTAQPQIPANILKEIIISFPQNKEEQLQIVKQIESRLSVCDSIEQNIKESLAKAEALRQSILKKAFEGNLLTAQELEECKQAVDYEPASVLLERIKAEQNKESSKPSKKKVVQPLVVAQVETPAIKISADIHAGLIAKVIKIHEENPASIDNLSHIKCEKIAHLVEYHLQIPLGRQPVKDAAGPDDFPHLKKIEHRAEKAGFFNKINKSIGHSYSSTRNSNKVIEKFESLLSVEKNKQLDDLLALFLKFDLEVSEIIATTYAGWNNLILNGNTNPSDEEIVYESRENWSERKLKIARERFFKAIDWMRKNEIVPTGYGAVVPFPKKKN